MGKTRGRRRGCGGTARSSGAGRRSPRRSRGSCPWRLPAPLGRVPEGGVGGAGDGDWELGFWRSTITVEIVRCSAFAQENCRGCLESLYGLRFILGQDFGYAVGPNMHLRWALGLLVPFQSGLHLSPLGPSVKKKIAHSMGRVELNY